MVLTEPEHAAAALGAGADDVLVRATATDDEARLAIALSPRVRFKSDEGPRAGNPSVCLPPRWWRGRA